MKFRAFLTLLLALLSVGAVQAQKKNMMRPPRPIPRVYMIKEISPESLIKVYKALGRKAEGEVAVKISTGEPGGSNFLDPNLIGPLVDSIKGTIVECNTAYAGRRLSTEEHLEVARMHGFTDIAPVVILDAEGESMKLPVRGGKHLNFHLVGSHYADYDFTVVLSHFKGHAMGGFGGAVKNISIGLGSTEGKALIHSAGTNIDCNTLWQNLPAQEDFLESMAEAAKAVVDYAGNRILYINVANNLSVDCDCSSNPAPPSMKDIGILASLDPIALDKACTDLVRLSDDPGKDALIERFDSRKGMHTLEYGEQIGVGSQTYELIMIE